MDATNAEPTRATAASAPRTLTGLLAARERDGLRRLVTTISILAMTTLLFSNPVASAQEGTPERGEGDVPEEVTFEPLAMVAVDELPPAPAVVVLARVTHAPGTGQPAHVAPGAVLVSVESGAFTFEAEGPLMVMRAATMGTPGPLEETSPGTEIAAGPGDAVFIPAGTVHAVHNTGNGPAIATVTEIIPAEGEPVPSPAAEEEAVVTGLTVQLLAAGVATDVPTGPTTVVLGRFTLAPGASAPPEEPHRGPEIIALETGTLAVTVTAGEARIVRATEMATPGAEPGPGEIAPVDSEITLTAGDAFFAQTGSAETARNPDDTPVVALVVIIGPPE